MLIQNLIENFKSSNTYIDLKNISSKSSKVYAYQFQKIWILNLLQSILIIWEILILNLVKYSLIKTIN